MTWQACKQLQLLYFVRAFREMSNDTVGRGLRHCCPACDDVAMNGWGLMSNAIQSYCFLVCRSQVVGKKAQVANATPGEWQAVPHDRQGRASQRHLHPLISEEGVVIYQRGMIEPERGHLTTFASYCEARYYTDRQTVSNCNFYSHGQKWRGVFASTTSDQVF